jgi:hypothetical protein
MITIARKCHSHLCRVAARKFLRSKIFEVHRTGLKD